MIKKILPLLLIFLVSCSSPKPPVNNAKPKSKTINKSAAPKPSPGNWDITTYSGSQSETSARKYLKFDANGSFSNSTVKNNYLNAVIIIDKVNAGILLHQSKKSSPAEKFNGPVHISMKNRDGNKLELTSSRGWNKSGGIMIERNNNDYSQFRIFMLQNDGPIDVEIHGDSSSLYHFEITAAGFTEAFSQI